MKIDELLGEQICNLEGPGTFPKHYQYRDVSNDAFKYGTPALKNVCSDGDIGLFAPWSVSKAANNTWFLKWNSKWHVSVNGERGWRQVYFDYEKDARDFYARVLEIYDIVTTVTKSNEPNIDQQGMTEMASKPKTWYTLFEKIAPHVNRILIYGPPGTAKTTTAQRHFESLKKSVYSVTLTQDSVEQELIGHFVPAGGDFVWVDGPALRAWKEGAGLIINEIGEASGPVLTKLYAILDDPAVAQIAIPSGIDKTGKPVVEIVKPAPGFKCIGTTNESPDVLPEALLDRFTVRIEADVPTADQIKALKDERAKTAVKNAYAARKKGGVPSQFVSYRQISEFLTLAEHTNEETAAMAVFRERGGEFLTGYRLTA